MTVAGHSRFTASLNEPYIRNLDTGVVEKHANEVFFVIKVNSDGLCKMQWSMFHKAH